MLTENCRHSAVQKCSQHHTSGCVNLYLLIETLCTY